MYTFPKNIDIELKAIDINTGGSELTISTFEWKINNINQNDNTDIFIFNTSDLNYGLNTLSLRVQNSCGSWSEENKKEIYIGEIMQKDVQVIVNAKIVNVDVIMEREGDVNFTAKDDSGVPLLGCIITMTGKTVTTDNNGKATLTNIPYGTYNASITTSSSS